MGGMTQSIVRHHNAADDDIVNKIMPSRIRMLQTPTAMSNVVKCIVNKRSDRVSKIKNTVVKMNIPDLMMMTTKVHPI